MNTLKIQGIDKQIKNKIPEKNWQEIKLIQGNLLIKKIALIKDIIEVNKTAITYYFHHSLDDKIRNYIFGKNFIPLNTL